MKEKLKEFFRSNQLLRKIRNFFNQVFWPSFVKGLLGLITLLLLIFIILKIFKPVYVEKIYQKSTFYFFHYLNLDNQELSNIKINGNRRVSDEEILKIVEHSKNSLTQKKFDEKDATHYQPLIQNLIEEIKKQLPWIDKVVITRSMPNLLNISVTEYEPFAIWQNDGKKYLTDKEGNLVPYEDSEEFKHMIILSGKNANQNAKSLFNILAIDPALSTNVYSATWVSDRRWDIRFENGLLIKLPESNIAKSWQRLIKIYNMPGSIVGLKIIDLRIPDKIYLEYDDSVIKEIKKL
jgi:cell division protein FtsQ